MTGRTWPSVSVVMPVFNAEATIEDQLAALAAQQYAGEWEVIVADNGSADRSVAIAEGWADRFESLRIVDASLRRGGPFARNRGVDAARGEVVLMCDADDVVVGHRWIAALVAGLDEYDVVCGAFDESRLNDPTIVEWHRPIKREGNGAPTAGRTVPGGNFGTRVATYRELGGYREDLQGGDFDFSIRAAQSGLRIGVVDEAVVAIRHRTSLRGLARQSYRRAANHFATRSLHSDLSRSRTEILRTAVSYAAWLLVNLPLTLFSKARRGRWLRIAALCAGWAVSRVRPSR